MMPFASRLVAPGYLLKAQDFLPAQLGKRLTFFNR
jgi:hypothetical protein